MHAQLFYKKLNSPDSYIKEAIKFVKDLGHSTEASTECNIIFDNTDAIFILTSKDRSAYISKDQYVAWYYKGEKPVYFLYMRKGEKEFNIYTVNVKKRTSTGEKGEYATISNFKNQSIADIKVVKEKTEKLPVVLWDNHELLLLLTI
jgi:hypothetical protein